MSDLFPPTLDEQIAELERELEMRKRVYPDLVQRKRMPARRAQLQTQRLEAAIATLKTLQPRLVKAKAAPAHRS